jgi:hypothetical protein
MYSGIVEDLSSISIVVVGIAITYALFLIAYVSNSFFRDHKISRTFDIIMNSDLGIAPILGHTGDIGAQSELLVRGLHGELRSDNERLIYREAVLLLNRLEALSIGITHGFYSEEVLFDYSRPVLISSYRAAQPYIEMARSTSGNPSLFVNLEAIARRWESRRRGFD